MRRVSMAGAALLTIAAAAPGYKFSYTYPPQARTIPALRAWFDRQATALRAGVAGEAAAARGDGDRAPYEAVRTWKVVTDTPRFLSLSLDRYDDTGGIHGNPSFGSLIYDRSRGLRMRGIDFFTSAPALRAAIDQPFCTQLGEEQARNRRQYPVSPDYARCIDPMGQTLILGSTDRRRFDKVGVLIPPYNAGPYSEGSYEVTVPVTPAVLAAVRPEFRGYFRATGAP